MPFNIRQNYFWIIMAFFILRRLLSEVRQDPAGYITSVLIMLPGIIIGLTVHEFAHAYASYKLGDNTPKIEGRVTLNPLAHIDPFGFVCLLLGGFGWGKAVNVNPYNYKNPKRDSLIVDLAGVACNLILAFVFAVVLKILSVSYPLYAAGSFSNTIYEIVYYAISINLVLMVFNLIPIPPLDGFGVLTFFIPRHKIPFYDMLNNFGSLILILIIWTGLISKILTPVVTFFMQLFFTILGINLF